MTIEIKTTGQVLFTELSQLIEQSKRFVVQQANSTLTMLFWNVGKRINESVLQNKRADYGKKIVPTLSAQLVEKYGKNFEKSNLTRMMKFAELFPDLEIVAPLAQQLSWSHFRELIPLKTNEERLFYAIEAAERRWGKRELRKSIERKEFERTEIANLQVAATDSILPFNVFKDPYFLDFLNLPKGYIETELEDAILRELERFILEIGKGFAFVERQKRMIIDDEDFHLDLLFYNRTLRRLVAIDLKLRKFQAKDKGQMELYLKWLDRYERQEGENPPVGLILCAEGSREQIELLEMQKDGIVVAQYWTELPPKALLEQKIREIITETKERFARENRLAKHED
ncbi:MAG: PDDEXK nuclease domain-containing protein [Dysgonamonadaceae bacterium]|jgi:predicted nuclease of restriction endonuclease-like (RecB) superfamily|nr:PDDEXK nuclease domain-containing protein [Dysgonamonadaceae bacterium]